MKNRTELLREMLVQLEGVFRYYTDQKLTVEQVTEIRGVLERVIPQTYTSEAWESYKEEYEARVAAESCDEDKQCQL